VIGFTTLSKEKKIIKLVFAPVLVVVLGIVVVYFFLSFSSTENKEIFLPQEFVEARKSASEISQEVVNLTSGVRDKIKIADVHSGKEDALKIISEAKSLNVQTHQKIVDLSYALQVMAGSLFEIQPIESQRVAYEAITTEISLISEFFAYTEHLNAFLNDLESIALSGEGTTPFSEGNLNKANEKVEVINTLNKEFLSKIEVFDKSL